MYRWEQNARAVRDIFGGFVDWDEGFYNCPECGESIYKDDWDEDDLDSICPICGFPQDEDDEFEELEYEFDSDVGFNPYVGAYTFDC